MGQRMDRAMSRSMRTWLCAAIALSAAVLIPSVNQARGAEGKTKLPKLDRVLQRAMDKHDPSSRRVIVRSRPGHSDAVADRVAKRGDRIEKAHRRGVQRPWADGCGCRRPDVETLSTQSFRRQAEALEFAIEHKDDLKIDIINLSLGHPIYESPETDPLVNAVEDAVRAGIVVVTSAGNYGINQETGDVGYAGITSPGNAPSAITIGALDTQQTAEHSDDTVAPYSSRGPAWYSGLAKPDLVAPGSRLVAVGAYGGRLYSDHPERRVNGNAGDRRGRYSPVERDEHGGRGHERRRRADD